jgi:hypothetical protein
LLAGAITAGCFARVRESHYFATYDSEAPGGEPVNFFRLSVDGGATFANARYVSGFYDERAVDLFFNELKSNDERTLFQENLRSPGTETVLRPLDPDERGAFVMLMSTNADAIANAIGSFSESQAVADSIVQLVYRDELREAAGARASASGRKVTAAAFAAELNELLAEDALTSSALAQAAFLRAINLAARELGATQTFTDTEEARRWFQLRSALEE